MPEAPRDDGHYALRIPRPQLALILHALHLMGADALLSDEAAQAAPDVFVIFRPAWETATLSVGSADAQTPVCSMGCALVLSVLGVVPNDGTGGPVIQIG